MGSHESEIANSSCTGTANTTGSLRPVDEDLDFRMSRRRVRVLMGRHRKIQQLVFSADSSADVDSDARFRVRKMYESLITGRRDAFHSRVREHRKQNSELTGGKEMHKATLWNNLTTRFLNLMEIEVQKAGLELRTGDAYDVEEKELAKAKARQMEEDAVLDADLDLENPFRPREEIETVARRESARGNASKRLILKRRPVDGSLDVRDGPQVHDEKGDAKVAKTADLAAERDAEPASQVSTARRARTPRKLARRLRRRSWRRETARSASAGEIGRDAQKVNQNAGSVSATRSEASMYRPHPSVAEEVGGLAFRKHVAHGLNAEGQDAASTTSPDHQSTAFVRSWASLRELRAGNIQYSSEQVDRKFLWRRVHRAEASRRYLAARREREPRIRYFQRVVCDLSGKALPRRVDRAQTRRPYLARKEVARKETPLVQYVQRFFTDRHIRRRRMQNVRKSKILVKDAQDWAGERRKEKRMQEWQVGKGAWDELKSEGVGEEEVEVDALGVVPKDAMSKPRSSSARRRERMLENVRQLVKGR